MKPPRARVVSETEQALIHAGESALRAGDFNTALRLFRKGQRLYPGWPSFTYNIACCHALHGDVNAALDALKRALENGFRKLDNLNNDLDLQSLRSHEEFKRIHARWVAGSKYADVKTMYRGQKLLRSLVNDIEDAQRVRAYQIGRRKYARIKFGAEKEPWGDRAGRCQDCGVFATQFHQPGCDIERCPKCHRQAISCQHLEKTLYGRQSSAPLR